MIIRPRRRLRRIRGIYLASLVNRTRMHDKPSLEAGVIAVGGE